MDSSGEKFDEAMYVFSQGDYSGAVKLLESVLEEEPEHFDALLALGMACHRSGDVDRAIREGHRAEKLRPNEQLVHTNLSLFYVSKGDKKTAEHHGLQARIASWKGNMQAPSPTAGEGSGDESLRMAGSAPPKPIKLPEKFPDMPWKKNKPAGQVAPAKPSSES